MKSKIRIIHGFPKAGIDFLDITTLLKDAEAFGTVLENLAQIVTPLKPDFIAGIESRGFIFGAALAAKLKVGFVPIRKKGKLPAKTLSKSYSLEYGSDTIEIHADAFNKGFGENEIELQDPRVVLVDDLIATGGTAAAAAELIRQMGARLLLSLFIIELEGLCTPQTKAQIGEFYSLLSFKG